MARGAPPDSPLDAPPDSPPDSPPESADSPSALHHALGANVRHLRTERGLTIKDLADKAGLSSRFLGEVERGRANPSLHSLQELAGALEVHLFCLLQEGSVPSPVHAELHRRLGSLTGPDAEALLDAVDRRVGTRRPVALLGLRGAGKSTIGQLLAERTGRPFLETDRLVEREAGMPLASIFELHGEDHYRELERGVLESVLEDAADPPPVLEVSGGVVTVPETFELLRRRALTLWLKASPQDHWDRVVAQGDRRPMGGRDRARAELEELYQRRSPLYARAAATVETSGKSPAEVCDEVARLSDPARRSPEA